MAADAPLPKVARPSDLTAEQRAVWDRLAPLALAQRTLTPQTVERFRLLCQAIVMEQAMAAKLLAEGWTYTAVTIDGSGQERETLKAHPLCGPHRGMMQRVESGMVAFRLAPTGRPLADDNEARPKSALETLQAQRRIHAVK